MAQAGFAHTKKTKRKRNERNIIQRSNSKKGEKVRLVIKGSSEQSRHICGSPYSENHCENLFYAKPGDKIGDKKLEAYSLYCLAGKRPRKISNMASWTGLTPKWCSKLAQNKIKGGQK